MKNHRFNNRDMVKVNLFLINQIRREIEEEKRELAENYPGKVYWYPADPVTGDIQYN